MNTTLDLLAKAFKVNTIPTNNNQRSLLIPCDIQIAQSGMNTSQDIKMQMVDANVGNQYGNGNVVTTPTEGNGNGINDNLIRCYNYRGEGHYASNCIEFEFMTTAYAHEETERVKVNCTSEDTLQQASTSGTQSNKAPVYDSNGSAEVHHYDNCYNNDIFNMLTQEVKYTDLRTEFDRTKEKLENCIIRKEKEYVVLWNNWHHKRYENTMFTKQSILGKPPSSSKPKLYSLTPFPKSLVLSKVDKTNDLSKPVTSNLAPSTRESKVMQTVNVISPRIFRSNPSKTSRSKHTAKTRRPHPRSNSNTDRVPSKSKSSFLSNNVEKIEENHRNSQIPKNQKHMSSECNNITLSVRSVKSKIVCVMCKKSLVTANHDVCVLNYVNDMNSRADNQSANVSIRENQKKRKANAKKSKELGSKGSIASSRPNKPRTYFRWIPTGRFFAMCGKLTASSNTENKSKKAVCDNNRRDLPRNTPLDRVEVLVAASLSEFELKKILIDKIETNQSINRSNIQKNLYNALVESYNTDKDIISTYSDVVTLKRGRDDQDKDEDPSVGSDRETKRRKSSKDAEPSKGSKSTESKSSRSSKGTQSQYKSSVTTELNRRP
nr:hypothetical protein [Tanacetum cinerariifolium]